MKAKYGTMPEHSPRTSGRVILKFFTGSISENDDRLIYTELVVPYEVHL